MIFNVKKLIDIFVRRHYPEARTQDDIEALEKEGLLLAVQQLADRIEILENKASITYNGGH